MKISVFITLYILGNLGLIACNKKTPQKVPYILTPTPIKSGDLDDKKISRDPVEHTDGHLVSVTVDKSVPSESVDGYIVGQMDTYRLKSSNLEKGIFIIPNLPKGVYDLIVTGNGEVDKASRRGIRVNSIDVTTTAYNQKLSLPLTGSLSGSAKLANQIDHAGIHIYIPGTGYSAWADKEGRYTIKDVPIGIHEIYFEKVGYKRTKIAKVDLATEVDQAVAEVTLELDLDISGLVSLNGNSPSTNSRTVEVEINTSSDNVTAMMYSEDPNFSGQTYSPFLKKFTYTFSESRAPLKNVLYLKLNDGNGLTIEGKAEIIIDDQPPKVDLSKVQFKENEPNLEISLRAEDSNNVTYMKIALSPQDIPSSVWQEYHETFSYRFSEWNTAKSLYIKLKDELKNESEIIKLPVVVGILTFEEYCNLETAPADIKVTIERLMERFDEGMRCDNAAIELNKLTILDLRRDSDQVKPITNIAPLVFFKNLRNISLGKNEVEDLSPLKKGDLSLEELNLDSNKIIDISPLESQPNLSSLNLAANNIEDISSLSSLIKLKILVLSSNQKLSNLTGITQDHKDLNDLDASQCALSDISTLGLIHNLGKLHLEGNKLDNRDLDHIFGHKSLQTLYIGNNNISSLNDPGNINHISSLTNLNTLEISSLNLSDLSPIAQLKQLKLLYARNATGNKEIDLGFIRNFDALEKLHVGTGLTNEALAIFAESNLKASSTITTLNISSNSKVTDIAPLKNLTKLEKFFGEGLGVDSNDSAKCPRNGSDEAEVPKPISDFCLGFIDKWTP